MRLASLIFMWVTMETCILADNTTKTFNLLPQMLTVNQYTGEYQSALRPRATFRVGSFVRIHDSPDARELDNFRSCLALQGLRIGAWQKRFPRLKVDSYKIEKAN